MILKPRLLEFCEPRKPLQNSDRVRLHVVQKEPGYSPRGASSLKWNLLLFAGSTKNRNAGGGGGGGSQRGLASFEQRLRDAGSGHLPGPGLAVWPSASSTATAVASTTAPVPRPSSAKGRPATANGGSGTGDGSTTKNVPLCTACSSKIDGPSIPIPHDLDADDDNANGNGDDGAHHFEKKPAPGVIGVGQRPSRPYSAPSQRDIDDVKRLLSLVQMRTGESVANFGCTVPASTSPYRQRQRPASAHRPTGGSSQTKPSEVTLAQGHSLRNPIRCAVVAAYGDDIRTGIAPAPLDSCKKPADKKVEGEPRRTPRVGSGTGPAPPPRTDMASSTKKHFTYRRNFDGFTTLESWQLPAPRTFQFAANTVPSVDRFSPTRWKSPAVPGHAALS